MSGWPTVPFKVSSTMLPYPPVAEPLESPIRFNGGAVEGAAIATQKAIIENSPTGGLVPRTQVQGFEKYIPLLIIGLVLYFVFK